MMTYRLSQDRGHADHGWLKTWHSFSFAEYYDPKHMGWGNLRVINEDWIAPGTGFGLHGHRDMEIVTYVVAGSLAHKDSLGNGTTIRTGEVQRMTAGTGVRHSEFNPDPQQATHLFQIWIQPDQQGMTPSYEQAIFAEETRRDVLCLIASPDGAHGSLRIQADARLYAALLDGEERIEQTLTPERKAYIHVISGQVNINGQTLGAGDAAQLINESSLLLTANAPSEILVFDLAP